MPGEVDILIEIEHPADSNYEGKLYLKAETFNYILHHFVKFYDLALFSAISQMFNWEEPLPPLAVDFGKHTETFEIGFILNDIDRDTNEERLAEVMRFIRFKSAYVGLQLHRCFIYIGMNIKDDSTRIISFPGKGIPGKIANLDSISRTKEGFIKGKIKFIQCIGFESFGVIE